MAEGLGFEISVCYYESHTQNSGTGVTLAELKHYKSKDILYFTCFYCGKTGKSRQTNLVTRFKVEENPRLFCSHKCVGSANNLSKTVKCLRCDKEFLKKSAELRKSINSFCSRSCAATYNNKHKTHGTRKSKLEIFLASKISETFPELLLLPNDKKAIGSELDLYFPTLSVAIEINGIFHYKPIFGEEKLQQIQNNDKEKNSLCSTHGINLITIDSSSIKYLDGKTKEKYWSIIHEIITNLL